VFQVDHHRGDAEGSLIDSQDAIVAGDDTAIGLQTSEGALDFPAPVMAPQLAATPCPNLFLKPALE
jgi:hypothetical protein